MDRQDQAGGRVVTVLGESRPPGGPEPRTEGAGPPLSRARGLRGGVRRLAPPLGIFAVSRAALGLVLLVALKLPSALGVTRFLAYWDGGWYLEIAKHGYPRALAAAPGQTDHAFFPIYPLLIRALHAITGSWAGSAIVLNMAASAVAVAVIYLLIERLSDGEVALRTVTLISFFPWAFIFSFAYSEGLLLLLAGVCLLALLDERWLIAGLAAAVAGAVRPNGFVLFLPCAWAAVAAFRRTRSVRPFAAPFLAPWGILGFFLFLQVRTGDFFANLDARNRGWSQHGIMIQFSKVGSVIKTYLANPLQDFNRTASLAMVVFVAVCVVLMARWRPPMIIWLYTVPILLLAAYYDTYASMPRFVLTAFPLFAALARPLRDGAFWAVICTSAMLMAALFCLIGTSGWMVP